jgi:hypothetical protein
MAAGGGGPVPVHPPATSALPFWVFLSICWTGRETSPVGMSRLVLCLGVELGVELSESKTPNKTSTRPTAQLAPGNPRWMNGRTTHKRRSHGAFLYSSSRRLPLYWSCIVPYFLVALALVVVNEVIEAAEGALRRGRVGGAAGHCTQVRVHEMTGLH